MVISLKTFLFFHVSLLYFRIQVDSYWHAYDDHKFHHLKKTNKCVRNYEHHHLPDHSSLPTNYYSPQNSNAQQTEDETNYDTTHCPCYHEATRPYTSNFIEQLSLWPNLMTQHDFEHGESVYGSKIALDYIWKHQNPVDCANVKYIVSGGWPYGFGSRLHMEGIILGIGLHLGRVYLPHPDGDNIFWETDNPFCKEKQKDSTLTCFYEPSSHCKFKMRSLTHSTRMSTVSKSFIWVI
jgi:hypothetical protein